MAAELNTILTGFQHGTIDRSLFTFDCNAYFTPETLTDFRSTLAPLGEVKSITRASNQQRGGMTGSAYKATFATGTTITISIYVTSDGKIEQLLVTDKS